MDNQKYYEDTLQRLARYGYEVFPEGQGYIVRHLSDHNDVSRMRNLEDLLEFADLIEWAEQRRASGNLNKQEQKARSANPPAPQHHQHQDN